MGKLTNNSEAAKALSLLGAAKGGEARAAKLSPEERSRIARVAVEKRWAKAGRLRSEAERMGYKATHKGSFKETFGIDVECYVLNDENKTAVISQTGMGSALGLSARGNALPRFLMSKAMTETVSAQLRSKLAKPLVFQWQHDGAQLPTIVHGYDVTLLADVCNAVIEAESRGLLDRKQRGVARQAHVIVGASAKAGMKWLVYALAGYNPSVEEVIQAFKLYVQEEAKKYEPEFPPELYVQWQRLYDIPIPERGKPWQFKHLTVRHVYFPLAKSSGRILELLRALKAQDGTRSKKLFQFLNGIGARALRIQLGRILEMCESSPSKSAYERKIVERFGGQQELEFMPNPDS